MGVMGRVIGVQLTPVKSSPGSGVDPWVFAFFLRKVGGRRICEPPGSNRNSNPVTVRGCA